jgi:glycosyltransferase involved in cell wall biosynthesis
MILSANPKRHLRIAGGHGARHYVAGGTEHGGGIGRLVGYVLDSSKTRNHRVTDTRGPRWSISSPFKLMIAIIAMVGDRIFDPDRIQHLHIAGRGSTARKLILGAVARAIGSRHSLHLHDYDYASDFLRRPAWQRRAIQTLFRKADRVIVLGERDQTVAVDLLGVPPGRVVVMHNAVPDPARPKVTPLPNAKGDVRIVFLGQLGPRKGVPDLLKALADPVMTGLRWRAVLAGDGPVQDYRKQADALGLKDRVILPGWLDGTQTKTLCATSDILVLPSYGEGMAMAVLEGMAHGMAIVTTRVGAHEEALTDDQTAVFVPVGDPSTLAHALAALVCAPEKRRCLGEAARAHYLASFSMDAYLTRLDALYATLRPAPRALRSVRRPQV